VEGAEGGTEWSVSEMEYGSEANPGTSPTAAGRDCGSDGAGTPKLIS